MKLWLALLFLALITVVRADGMRLCGRRLVDMLQKLCHHRYRNPKAVFRSGGNLMRATQPGIVDACCFATCTYSTLMRYCEPSETTTASTRSETMSSAAAARTTTIAAVSNQVRTFPSLFHLLNYISDVLRQQPSKASSEQHPLQVHYHS